MYKLETLQNEIEAQRMALKSCYGSLAVYHDPGCGACSLCDQCRAEADISKLEQMADLVGETASIVCHPTEGAAFNATVAHISEIDPLDPNEYVKSKELKARADIDWVSIVAKILNGKPSTLAGVVEIILPALVEKPPRTTLYNYAYRIMNQLKEKGVITWEGEKKKVSKFTWLI